MPTLIPDKLTPLSSAQAVNALREGYRRVFGAVPSDGVLAVLVAQSALETGRWRLIHWNNFGNEKLGGYDGKYCQFACDEIINSRQRWFYPPHPATSFRAYDTAEEGAEAHIRFLSQSQRYAEAWEQILRGDPAAFSKALKAHGYYTANEVQYTAAVVSLFREFLAVIRSYEPPVIGPSTDDLHVLAVDAAYRFPAHVDRPELELEADTEPPPPEVA